MKRTHMLHKYDKAYKEHIKIFQNKQYIFLGLKNSSLSPRLFKLLFFIFKVLPCVRISYVDK